MKRIIESVVLTFMLMVLGIFIVYFIESHHSSNQIQTEGIIYKKTIIPPAGKKGERHELIILENDKEYKCNINLYTFSQLEVGDSIVFTYYISFLLKQPKIISSSIKTIDN